MKKITLSEYNSISEAYRGVWTTERWDIPDWAEMRKKHIGKRTMMVYDNGTCLLVEGLGFEIVDDSSWKKPDEVRKEIGSHYLKFYTEKGCEPHYADCVIRWNDTLETEEARIALAMDADGIPLYYKLFPGNTHDSKTFIPVFKDVCVRFNPGRVIAVADMVDREG